jgi:hypothetical protein
MVFSLGGDVGLDILASNSPASQQIDCTTGNAVQFAITTPTQVQATPAWRTTPMRTVTRIRGEQ